MTWGPWIEHDGKGCPCVGMYVQAEHVNIILSEGIAGLSDGKCWTYGNKQDMVTWTIGSNGKRGIPVIRYRIRKPKGLTLLEEIAKNPERELEYV